MKYEKVDPATEEIATKVVDAAFKIHSMIGPGLLESVYETLLCHELTLRGLKFKKQMVLPLVYEGLTLEAGLRLDLLVEEVLVVEIKSIETLLKVHRSQLKTYLKLSDKKLGLLVNFNVPLMKEGIERVVLTKRIEE
jgi:GxxExxY protein